MNKSIKKILLMLIICFSFSTIVFAHPGRTDSNGGHYNRSTGEYHYHDGSSANQYKYNNKKSISTTTNNVLITENTKTEKTKDNDNAIEKIMAYIVLFILFGLPLIMSVAYFPIMALSLFWDNIKKKPEKLRSKYMKEKLHEFIYNIIYVFSLFLIWYECCNITGKIWGQKAIGCWIALLIIYAYITYQDKNQKNHTEKEILEFIEEKAVQMNITPEEYIRKVKEYEKSHINKE